MIVNILLSRLPLAGVIIGRPQDLILKTGMRKNEITERLARESDLSPAAAADEVDRVVHRLVKRLRQGKQVSLPGLGKLKVESPAGAARNKSGERKKTA